MNYRNNGAIGALLDEYQRAIHDLKICIQQINDVDLIKIVDPLTKDLDCRSIQTVLTHVVRAGYNYVIAIRNFLGESLNYEKNVLNLKLDDYLLSLDKMFEYTEALFLDYPDIELEGNDLESKIHSNWGNYYDVEQLMEHAIVHVLRHRRQIERFIQKMNR